MADDPEAGNATPSDAGDGEEADEEVELPTHMKVPDADGKVKSVPLGVDKVKHMCGMPPPPGGWYGPFGFYRLVGIFFAVLAAVAVVGAILAICQMKSWGICSAVVLTFAAGLCGWASYAHEGIAKQVSALGRQNDLYAEKNNRFAAQVRSLDPIQQKLDSAQTSLGMNSDQLEDLIHTLHQLTSIDSLLGMVRAFTDADLSGKGEGRGDQVLKGTEVTKFFKLNKNKFEQAATEFDFAKLEALAAEHGFGLYEMQFCVGAVIHSGDELPGKSAALFHLVMFSMDPDNELDALVVSLRSVLKDWPEDEMTQALTTKAANRNDENEVPCKDLKDIADRVMTAGVSPSGNPSRPRSLFT